MFVVIFKSYLKFFVGVAHKGNLNRLNPGRDVRNFSCVLLKKKTPNNSKTTIKIQPKASKQTFQYSVLLL